MFCSSCYGKHSSASCVPTDLVARSRRAFGSVDTLVDNETSHPRKRLKVKAAQEQQRVTEEAQEQQRVTEEAQEQQRVAEEAQEQQRVAEEAQEQQRVAEEAQEQQRVAEAQEQQRVAEEAQKQQRMAEEAQKQQRVAEEPPEQPAVSNCTVVPVEGVAKFFGELEESYAYIELFEGVEPNSRHKKKMDDDIVTVWEAQYFEEISDVRDDRVALVWKLSKDERNIELTSKNYVNSDFLWPKGTKGEIPSGTVPLAAVPVVASAPPPLLELPVFATVTALPAASPLEKEDGEFAATYVSSFDWNNGDPSENFGLAGDLCIPDSVLKEEATMSATLSSMYSDFHHSSLTFNIAGSLLTLSAYYYSPAVNMDAKEVPKSFLNPNDSRIFYRWQQLGALIRKLQNPVTLKFEQRVYFEMTRLRSERTSTTLILLMILKTLCPDPIYHHVCIREGDKGETPIVIEDFAAMKYFYCCPNEPIDKEHYSDLLSIWVTRMNILYDKNRMIPRDYKR